MKQRSCNTRDISLENATIQQYNTIVDAPYVTSESEARDDDDQVGDEQCCTQVTCSESKSSPNTASLYTHVASQVFRYKFQVSLQSL